jgi:methyl-accepting chemotaxis protein
MVRDATIRSRLTVVVLLSLLSVFMLGYLFYAQSDKDIRFAQKEVLGAGYIAQVMPDLFDVLGGLGLADDNVLTARLKPYNAELATQEVASAYAEARSKLAPGYDGAYWSAARQLISKAGDGSNLILDPDIDSFYLMDVAVVKLPALVDIAAQLQGEVQRLAELDAVDSREMGAALALLGSFSSASQGAADSYEAALAGQNGDAIKANLGAVTSEVQEAAQAFSTAAAVVIGAPDAAARRGALAAVAARGTALAQSLGKGFADTNAELVRLLELRIDGLRLRLVTTLMAAAALVVLVFIVSAMFARSIVRSVLALGRDIRRMADDPSFETLDQVTQKTEIAEIARAVQYLRERTVMRLAELDEARRSEEGRAATSEKQAAADREGNLLRAAANAKAQTQMIADFSRALDRLAAGDLRCEIQAPFAGEMEGVRTAFNSSIGALRQTLLKVKASTQSIRLATGEILAGTNDLATRTSRQAATIQGTNLAIQDLAMTVQESARLAQSAKHNGEMVASSVASTEQAMIDTNLAMGQIEDSSKRIANIVGLIDDIAFQTNLLALNASVEAARAGDAGKGFAVVAVEVRRLAQSAAEASGQVKSLIEESRAHVVEGAQLVVDAEKRLHDMKQAADRNTDLIIDIARRAHAQATAIGVIEQSVQAIEESTQQNAALVEESNAAIAQTDGQSSELEQVVSGFALETEAARLRQAA